MDPDAIQRVEDDPEVRIRPPPAVAGLGAAARNLLGDQPGEGGGPPPRRPEPRPATATVAQLPLAQLTRKRGVFRAAVTRARAAVENGLPDLMMNRSGIAQAGVLLRQLEHAMEACAIAHDVVVDRIIADGGSEAEMATSEEWAGKLWDEVTETYGLAARWKAQADEHILQLEREDAARVRDEERRHARAAPRPEPGDALPVAAAPPAANPYAGAGYLKDAQLEKFDPSTSDWRKWKARWDIFYGEKGIPPRAKLSFLVGHTAGAATTAIEQFAMTDENYVKAMDALNARYGDDKVLKTQYFQRMRKIQAVDNPPTSEKLEKLHDLLSASKVNLEALGVVLTVEQTLPDWMAKLPRQLRETYEEKSRDNAWDTLDDFLRYVQEKASTLRSVELMDLQQGKVKPPPQQQANVAAVQGQGKQDQAGATGGAKPKQQQGQQQNDDKYDCIGCKGNGHQPEKCKAFMEASPKKRNRWVYGRKACQLCLRRGHTATQCNKKNSIKCATCSGAHHTLIHRDREDKSATGGSSGASGKTATVAAAAATGTETRSGPPTE